MKYDVLAVVGYEADTLHVERAGSVPDGTRIDSALQLPVEVIGAVHAGDREQAHRLACRYYLQA